MSHPHYLLPLIRCITCLNTVQWFRSSASFAKSEFLGTGLAVCEIRILAHRPGSLSDALTIIPSDWLANFCIRLLNICEPIWRQILFLAVKTLHDSVRFGRSGVSDSTTPWTTALPGLRVHHQLPECTQTHVHWVGDVIQPSHSLPSPSFPALNLSQQQGLFQWVGSSHQVAKVLELHLQHQSFQWTPRTDLL